ncbi:MAG: hypothetical protein A2V86_16255 [Deltaproteobacteria bacterium RBG_16_49_23]|nr:MAG: hypothetical protein A2V86_16255 [Deltaproteobacteria bacterium RBG_16_49_23]
MITFPFRRRTITITLPFRGRVGVGYAKASITPVVRSILVSSPRLMGHGKSYDRGGRGVFYGVLALRENRDKMKEQIYTLLKSHLKIPPCGRG